MPIDETEKVDIAERAFYLALAVVWKAELDPVAREEEELTREQLIQKYKSKDDRQLNDNEKQ